MPKTSRIQQALVTGGAGFIGSHIAEALHRGGTRVVVLDNLSTGSRANLAWARSGDAVEFIEGDIRDPDVVRRVMAGCDCVFHEAAIASVPYSVEHPGESHAVNLTATLDILEAAVAGRVRRLVFASSSAVYGDTDATANRESVSPSPQSPYALHKLAGEYYARLFHRLHGLETVCLRYFNVFGPRQSASSPYSGVIARFMQGALKGETPCIFGDGGQTRDFVYVANVVQANLLAACVPTERAAGRSYNVATGQSRSLLDLVAALDRLTGHARPPRFAPPRAGDVRHSLADIAAARADLDYSVDVDWDEGLRRTLDWYRGCSGSA
jgi:UDP-glucose 4-epimerase